MYVNTHTCIQLAMGWKIRGWNWSSGRAKNFHFSISSRPALGHTELPFKQVSVPRSPGVKRQEREAKHLPPSGVEVKRTWVYTFTPPYA
jgi:hypothetical protein